MLVHNFFAVERRILTSRSHYTPFWTLVYVIRLSMKQFHAAESFAKQMNKIRLLNCYISVKEFL